MTKKWIIAVASGIFLSAVWFYEGRLEPSKYPTQEIFSFHEAKNALEQADKNTLVLFDVDETLIVARDAILRGRYPLLFRFISWKFSQMNDRKFRHDRLSLIWKHGEQRLIESEVVRIINSLNKKGAMVLGLTSFGTSGIGVIPSLPRWRCSMLAGMGVNFTKEFADKVFDEFPADKANYPVLLEGILFTHHRKKGEVLRAFLEYSEARPSKIIFFDDLVKQLQRVGEACEELGITCTLFHYRGGEKIPLNLSARRLLKQFEYLVNERRYLSDEEADKLLWWPSLECFLPSFLFG